MTCCWSWGACCAHACRVFNSAYQVIEFLPEAIKIVRYYHKNELIDRNFSCFVNRIWSQMTKIGLNLREQMFLPLHSPVTKYQNQNLDTLIFVVVAICFFFFQTVMATNIKTKKFGLVFSQQLMQRKKQKCLKNKKLPKYVSNNNCCPNLLTKQKIIFNNFQKYSNIFFSKFQIV